MSKGRAYIWVSNGCVPVTQISLELEQGSLSHTRFFLSLSLSFSVVTCNTKVQSHHKSGISHWMFIIRVSFFFHLHTVGLVVWACVYFSFFFHIYIYYFSSSSDSDSFLENVQNCISISPTEGHFRGRTYLGPIGAASLENDDLSDDIG